MAEGPQVLRSCWPRHSPRPFCSQEKQSFPSLGCYEGFPLEPGSEGYVPGEGVGLGAHQLLLWSDLDSWSSCAGPQGWEREGCQGTCGS